MALTYSRKTRFELDPNYSVVSATATASNIYFLAQSTSGYRIYTLDDRGSIGQHVGIGTHGGVGLGFYFNNFMVFTALPGGRLSVNYYNVSGNLSEETPLNWGNSPLASIYTRVLGTPYGFDFDVSTLSYNCYAQMDPFDGLRIGKFTLEGALESSSLVLWPDSVIVLATVLSGNTNYVVFSDAPAKIVLLDNAFGNTGQTQPLGEEFTGENVIALAHNGHQLIVVDDNQTIYWYGPEPSGPPVGPQPIQQIFSRHATAIERFDITRGQGGSFEVIASNIEILRSSSLTLASLGTGTLQQRLSTVEVVPVWTVPDARQGDQMFVHEGAADDPPIQVPSNEPVYTINNILSVGSDYRQTFVVSASGE